MDLLDKLEAQSTDMSNDDTASSKKSGSSATEITKKNTKPRTSTVENIAEKTVEEVDKTGDSSSSAAGVKSQEMPEFITHEIFQFKGKTPGEQTAIEKQQQQQQNSRPATPDLRLARRRSTSSLEMSMRNQLQSKIQEIRGRKGKKAHRLDSILTPSSSFYDLKSKPNPRFMAQPIK